MILILALLTTSIVNTYAASDNALRIDLEKAFRNYITACQTGQLELAKENTSSYYYRSRVNEIARLGLELTGKDIKVRADNAAPIDELEFVKTVRNGDTAALIYTGVPAQYTKFAGDKPCFSVIKFVKIFD